MNVTLTDGTKLACDDVPIHSGAEGELFVSADGRSLIKLYWRDDPNRRLSLEAIIQRYNAVREHSYWSTLLCWPDGIVSQPRLGVKLPRAPQNLRNLTWFILPKSRARLSAEEVGTWVGHLGMAIRLSRAMRRLHQLGLCHSDLSFNNCLVDPRQGSLMLIDLDGLVVPGILPPQVDGTPKYMAPEIITGGAQPSIYTDLHALAVLLYQILLFRHPLEGPKIHAATAEEDDRLAFGERALFIEHLTDHSNRPRGRFVGSNILGSSVERLFQQAFVDGLRHRASRPQAAQWESALVRLADRILPCQNRQCPAKAFPYLNTLEPVCPWCQTLWRTPAELAVLDLYRPVSGRPGQYIRDDWQIVVREQQTLHEWHVYTDRSPGPNSNPAALASFDYDRAAGFWVLTNQSQTSMRLVAPTGPVEDIAPGKHAVLRDGVRLVLASEAGNARLAHVHNIRIK